MHRIPFLILLLLTIESCRQDIEIPSFDYGTDNDSARYYFHKGWQEILDHGRWTAAEVAFRKAAEIDPDCLLCQSLVGRITQDLSERQKILRQLKMSQDKANLDEKKLLEINMMSLEAANHRDQGIEYPDDLRRRRRSLAEKNFGQFSKKYPSDSYFKAEYIEFLHLNHGPAVALDTLKTIATAAQLQLGFYVSYKAILELELGRLNRAKELSATLDSLYVDANYLSPLVLQARIAKAERDTLKAIDLLEKAISLDSNHLIAKSLLSSISTTSNE